MQITINDVNNMTNMERDILRVVLRASTTAGLNDAVRSVTAFGFTDQVVGTAATPTSTCRDPHCAGCTFEEGDGTCSAQLCVRPQPVEPTEVLSPHVQVVELPAPPPSGYVTPSLDSRGLPWDRRIHASTKALNQDGTWRNMRGVDKDSLAQVEQELRAVQALPVSSPAATPSVPSAPTIIVAPFGQEPYEVPSAPPAPAMPQTFVQLMQYVTPKLVAGTLTQVRLQEIVGALGLPHLAALGTRPDLIPAVYAEVSK